MLIPSRFAFSARLRCRLFGILSLNCPEYSCSESGSEIAILSSIAASSHSFLFSFFLLPIFPLMFHYISHIIKKIAKGVEQMSVLTMDEIEHMIQSLLCKYHAEYALLFGSYARGDATPDSDIDVIIFGGPAFASRNIFALAEDLRELSGRNADVFEIREVDTGTPFYESVMREGIRIA